MENIVEKISKIEHLYKLKGCKTSQIQAAQKELGLEFPEEFIDYVKSYGAISFYATEWTGLNVPESLDVVHVTKEERNLNPNFPKDCFVLENQGIDGIITAVSHDGKVYAIQYEKKQLLCNSISEYLDRCIVRKNAKR